MYDEYIHDIDDDEEEREVWGADPGGFAGEGRHGGVVRLSGRQCPRHLQLSAR